MKLPTLPESVPELSPQTSNRARQRRQTAVVRQLIRLDVAQLPEARESPGLLESMLSERPTLAPPDERS